MSTKVGVIDIDLELNSKQFNSELGSVNSKANIVSEKLAGTFKKIGAAAAAAFSVSAIKQFGSEVIEQAARVTAANSQFTQTFGAFEKNARAALQSVAKESGIVDTRLQGVGTGIYAFAKTSGMDSVQALEMMRDALRVTADSAAYYDRSLEDVAESLQSFLKGNFANDAALGVSCTETTRNIAANKLFGKSYKDLSEAQKQLTLLQMVKDANELSGAMGQAAREADGWENVTGNLKEAWNQLLAAVGKPVLQGAVVVVKKLTEWLMILAQYARAAGDALGELFGWGSDQTAQTAANTAQTANAISDSVDNQNALTTAVKKTNAEVKRGLASFDKLNVISKSEGGEESDDTASTAPALGSAGTGNLFSEISGLNDGTDKLKKKLSKLFEPIKTTWEKYGKPVFDKVKGTYDRIKDKTKEWSKTLNLSGLRDGFEDVLQSVQPLADLLFGKGGAVEWVWGKLVLDISKRIVETDLPAFMRFVSGCIESLTRVTDGLFSVLKPLWDEMLSPMFDELSAEGAALLDDLKPDLIELGSEVGELFIELAPLVALIGASLLPLLKQLLRWFTGGLKDGLRFFTRTATNITLGAKGFMKMMKSIFIGDWSNVMRGFVEILCSAFNGVIDGLNLLWSAVYRTFVGIANVIGGTVKNIGRITGVEIGWELPKEPGLIPRMNASAAGSVPKFARGGIVKAPTLAVVGDNRNAGSGDPEVISPLSKLRGMINTSNSSDSLVLVQILDLLKKLYEMWLIFLSRGGSTYEFTAVLEGNELFREVVRQNEIYKKSHGGKSAI